MTPDDSELDDVCEALHAAGGFLEQHIRAHWPAQGKNTDLNEVNLSLHLGVQGVIRGWLVYQEVVVPKELLPDWLPAETDERIVDLLAIGRDARVALAVETKRVKANSLAKLDEQAGHLLELRLPCGDARLGRAQLRDTRCFVVLFAHTWETVPRWWRTLGSEADDPVPELSARPNIRRFLTGARTDVRDIAVKCDHFVMYAVRELGRGAFWMPKGG
jgi:hypothetical protein